MIRTTVFRTLAVVGVSIALGCDDDPVGANSDDRKHSETQTESFAVVESPAVVVDTFVGAIMVTQAAEQSVRVTATKRAAIEEDLQEVDVAMTGDGNEVRVTGTNPSGDGNVSADFELTVPRDARLELRSGVGSVVCEGQPMGLWSSDVGVGSIVIAAPADLDATVELTAGVGSVDVEFTVEGEVSDRRVVGTIGTGAGAEIVAHCGVGSVALMRQ